MRNSLTLLLSLTLFCLPLHAGVELTDTNDSVSFGDVTGIDGATALSVYIAVKFNSLATGRAILSKFGATTSDRNMILQIDPTNSDELRFGVTNASIFLLEPTSALNITTGVWYKIVATYTANSDINFYVNGSTYATTNDTDNVTALDATVNAPLTLGDFGDASGNSADMEVSEFCIWSNYTLTEVEAHALTSSNIKRHCLQFAPSSLSNCAFLDDNPDGTDANDAPNNTYFNMCNTSFNGTASEGAASSMTNKAESILTYP